MPGLLLRPSLDTTPPRLRTILFALFHDAPLFHQVIKGRVQFLSITFQHFQELRCLDKLICRNQGNHLISCDLRLSWCFLFNRCLWNLDDTVCSRPSRRRRTWLHRHEAILLKGVKNDVNGGTTDTTDATTDLLSGASWSAPESLKDDRCVFHWSSTVKKTRFSGWSHSPP